MMMRVSQWKKRPQSLLRKTKRTSSMILIERYNSTIPLSHLLLHCNILLLNQNRYCLWCESDRTLLSLNEAFIFSCSFCAQINIEDEKRKSNYILIWHLISPRSVLLGPSDITIIDEFRLISLFEISLEDFLLCLDGEVFVEAAPVVEVIVVKAKLLSQEVRQHKIIIIPSSPKTLSIYQSKPSPTSQIFFLFLPSCPTPSKLHRYIMMKNHKKSSILDLFPEEVWLRYDL